MANPASPDEGPRAHHRRYWKAPRVALLYKPFHPELIVNWSV
jgi:hypothetical protein